MIKLTYALYDIDGSELRLTGEAMAKELRRYADQIEAAVKNEDGYGIKAGRLCSDGFAIHCVEVGNSRSRWSKKAFFENLSMPIDKQ